MDDHTDYIFYTDDDPDDLFLFKDAAVAVSSEWKIVTQNSGDELFILLNNPPPAPRIIFLDLNMPGKNGFDILKQIRQTPSTKNIPVVIFSTSDDVKTIEIAKSLGATFYMPKPRSYSSLKNVIRKIASIPLENFTPGETDFVIREN